MATIKRNHRARPGRQTHPITQRVILSSQVRGLRNKSIDEIFTGASADDARRCTQCYIKTIASSPRLRSQLIQLNTDFNLGLLPFWHFLMNICYILSPSFLLQAPNRTGRY